MNRGHFSFYNLEMAVTQHVTYRIINQSAFLNSFPCTVQTFLFRPLIRHFTQRPALNKAIVAVLWQHLV